MKASKKKQKPIYRDLRPMLSVFAPLINDGIRQRAEEAITAKQFYLGNHEVEYQATLTGHEPIPYFAK